MEKKKGWETAVDSSTAELVNAVIPSPLWSNSDCPSRTFQLLRLGFDLFSYQFPLDVRKEQCVSQNMQYILYKII